MNLRNKVVSFAVASIFALGLGASALAAETENNVTQVIGAGQFTAYIKNGSTGMEAVSFSNSVQTSDGTLVLHVDDARGDDKGWDVSISSTGFYKLNGSQRENRESIPAANFQIVSYGDVSSPTNNNLSAVSQHNQNRQTGTLDTARDAMKASGGEYSNGTFEEDISVQLSIPAQTAVGTYEATITVGSSAFPND